MISVTCLSSYLYCQRKLYLEKVLKIRTEIPKEALIKGSIRHDIYEKINFAEQELVKSISNIDFQKILEKYKLKYLAILRQVILKNKNKLKEIEIPLTNFFSQLKPLIELEAEYRAEKIFNFASKSGFLKEELWENLIPKIKPEYRISSNTLGLRGIIDELEVYENCFIPIELKTGKAPAEGVWPGHKMQVAAYAVLIEEEFKVTVKNAIVRYLDYNYIREISLNPFLRQEVKKTIEKVNLLLKSDKIPGFPSNENKCKVCDFREFCFDEEALIKRINKTKDLNRT